MEIQKDFKEFLKLLNENKVEYVLVGAYAVAYYGFPRYTGDMDIYINPTKENAIKLIKVLKKFGFSSLGINESDLTEEDNVIQLGVAPVRIDILTSLSGVSWQEVISGVSNGIYDDVPVKFIGKKELIKNKKSLGRKKDLVDIEAINEGVDDE